MLLAQYQQQLMQFQQFYQNQVTGTGAGAQQQPMGQFPQMMGMPMMPGQVPPMAPGQTINFPGGAPGQSQN